MSEKKNANLVAKDPRSLWSKFMSLNGSSILIATIVAVILFEIILQMRAGGGGGLIFMSPANLLLILRQQVYIGVIAFGLTREYAFIWLVMGGILPYGASRIAYIVSAFRYDK